MNKLRILLCAEKSLFECRIFWFGEIERAMQEGQNLRIRRKLTGARVRVRNMMQDSNQQSTPDPVAVACRDPDAPSLKRTGWLAGLVAFEGREASACYADVVCPRTEPRTKKRTKSKTDVCAQCRKSKVRCGAERPCARCIKHNLQDICVSWRDEAAPTTEVASSQSEDNRKDQDDALERQIPSCSASGLTPEERESQERAAVSLPGPTIGLLPAGVWAVGLSGNTPASTVMPAIGLDSSAFVSVLNDKNAWDHLTLTGACGEWVPASTFMMNPDYNVVWDDELLDGVIMDPTLPPLKESYVVWHEEGLEDATEA